MNKTVLVLRHEVMTTLRRKSFLFTVFGLPLAAVLVFIAVSALQNRETGSGGSGGWNAPGGQELQAEGYVDHPGIIQAIPEEYEDILVAYPDEASAEEALSAGEITAYYVIAEDYVESGDLIYVNPEYNFVSATGQSWVMRGTITANLLGNDDERLARFWQPMEVQVTVLRPEQVSSLDDSNPLTFFVPYGTMLIFYMVILLSASLLLNSVNQEKSNRVIEILLNSATPQQLLTGKIVGLGLLGLFQTVIWVGTAWTLLRLSGRTFALPPGFDLPPMILVWGMVFFLLGYAVYASLMAGLGALVPNLREATQATILVIWPLIVPMLLIYVLIGQPHGPLAVGLSLFPLTAPIAMMTRLAAGSVPWWQPALSAVLLLATAFFILRAVSRMFHAQVLLSGQPFEARRFFRALLGRW